MNELPLPDWMLTADEEEFRSEMNELERRARRGLAPGRKWKFDSEPILRAIEEGPVPSLVGSLAEQVEELDRTLGDRVHLGTDKRRWGNLAYSLRFERQSLERSIEESAARRKKDVEFDRKQAYPGLVEPRKGEVLLDLSKLRTPEGAKVLIDIVQEADLSSETLTAIRDAALERVMRTRAFGDVDPTIEAFQEYLDSLPKLGKSTYDEKRDIVATVNHWKRRFGLTLFYKAPGTSKPQACTLAVTSPHRDEGGFRLRTAAPGAKSIYGAAPFPPLRAAKAG